MKSNTKAATPKTATKIETVKGEIELVHKGLKTTKVCDGRVKLGDDFFIAETGSGDKEILTCYNNSMVIIRDNKVYEPDCLDTKDGKKFIGFLRKLTPAPYRMYYIGY